MNAELGILDTIVKTLGGNVLNLVVLENSHMPRLKEFTLVMILSVNHVKPYSSELL